MIFQTMSPNVKLQGDIFLKKVLTCYVLRDIIIKSLEEITNQTSEINTGV